MHSQAATKYRGNLNCFHRRWNKVFQQAEYEAFADNVADHDPSTTDGYKCGNVKSMLFTITVDHNRNCFKKCHKIVNKGISY